MGPSEDRDHRRAVRRSSTSTSPTISSRRSRGRTPGSKGRRSTRCCSTSPRARRSTFGPRPSPRHQALRAARVHHGRRRAADAGVSALRARRDRLERPAAQRLARDPAAVAGRARRSATASVKRVLGAARGPGARTKPGQVRHVLEGVRPRAQGRRRRGLRQPRAHRQAAALLVDARRRRRADRLARRLRRAHEGRPGQDLLHHRRHLRGARRTARTWRSSARRASRCCCSPTASTSGWCRT